MFSPLTFCLCWLQESKDDDVERILKLHSELDLTCPMPGCHVTQRRHLLLESDLKLKDNSTSKVS